MTDTIFETEVTPPTEEISNSQSPESPSTILKEFVGPGKRFKSEAELLKSKFEGDVHIKTVEAENAGLRKELAELKTLVETAISGEPTAVAPTTGKQLSDAEIDARNEASLYRVNKKNRAKDNVSSVEAAVTEALGDADKAKAFVVQKAKELGMTVNDLMVLAAANPTIFYRSVGMEAPKSTQTVSTLPTTVQNLESAPLKNVKERTWPWYQELKKSNPKLYWDSKMQLQLMADAERLGREAFGL